MGYKKINESNVYKMGFDLAMKFFETSKRFPKEETYSLTGATLIIKKNYYELQKNKSR